MPYAWGSLSGEEDPESASRFSFPASWGSREGLCLDFFFFYIKETKKKKKKETINVSKLW